MNKNRKTSIASNEKICQFANTDKTNPLTESEVFTGGVNFPYKNPTPGQIPLIAEIPMPETFAALLAGKHHSEVTAHYCGAFDALAANIKACGFNAFIQGGTMLQTVPLYHAGFHYGLNPIVSANNFHDTVDHALYENEVFDRKYEAFWKCPFLNTFKLQDEPAYPAWGDAFYQLVDYSRELKEGNLKLETKFYVKENGKPFSPTDWNGWNGLTVGYKIAQTLNPDKLLFFTLAHPDQHWIKDRGWVLDGYIKMENGTYAGNGTTGSCDTYEKYLDVLQELFRPAVWCYDVYPFTIEIKEVKNTGAAAIEIKPNSKTVVTKYSHFFHSLEQFQAQAKKTNRPFWAYCMCTAHGWWERNKDNGVMEYDWFQPAPTVSMLRFEAFNALAFGAQGIIYYRFGMASHNFDIPGEQYLDAPLKATVTCPATSDESQTAGPCNVTFEYDDNDGKDGREVGLWRAVKTVNEEIQALKDVFLDAKLEKYGHFGMIYDDPKDTDNKEEERFGHLTTDALPYGPVIGIDVTNGDNDNRYATGVLVTQLVKGDKRFIVVVNHDPFYAKKVALWVIGVNFKFLTRWNNGKEVSRLTDDPFQIPSTEPRPIVLTIPPGNFSILMYYR